MPRATYSVTTREGFSAAAISLVFKLPLALFMIRGTQEYAKANSQTDDRSNGNNQQEKLFSIFSSFSAFALFSAVVHSECRSQFHRIC